MDESQDKKLFGDLSKEFLHLNISFITLSLVFRAYEILATTKRHPVPESIVSVFFQAAFVDIFFWLSALLVLGIIYSILRGVSKRVALIFHFLSLTILLFINFSLARYFSVTFLPLGSDLWGYSLEDILHTVRASNHGFEGLDYILFFLVLLIPISYRYLLRKKTFRVRAIEFLIICLMAPFAYSFISPEIGRSSDQRKNYLLTVNKTAYFAQKSIQYFRSTSSDIDHSKVKEEFPFLRENNFKDNLGEYFNFNSKKPDIVFIIVEGLGRPLVGEGDLKGFTPFLDELSKKSLYWQNALSSTGRTFGVIPSILSSLPHGKNGFLELEEMPHHLSLITLLKENSYTTRFFHGSNSSFDKIGPYLKSQGIDLIFDQFNFDENDERNPSAGNGFSWGFSDGAVFKRSLKYLSDNPQGPSLNIYLTVTTHEPFETPQKERFQKLYRERLSELSPPAEKLKIFGQYEPVFRTFLYTDTMLKEFFEDYQKSDLYSNSIFIITGDHRMIPVPAASEIEKYHVPLIIFSPMLKKAKKFKEVVGHWDITPTILALLEENFSISVPDKVHWLGNELKGIEEFQSLGSYPLMATKTGISDYLFGDYFLTEDKIFKLTEKMKLIPVNDEDRIKEVTERLNNYKELNDYVCHQDKLYPLGSGKKSRLEIGPENTYETVRGLARQKKYQEARELAFHLLKINPNHHDLRTLLGRIYAWGKDYIRAREELNEVIRRAPDYSDAYAALGQVELWTNNLDEAHRLAVHADRLAPNNNEYQVLLARVLKRQGRKAEALEVVNDILQRNPNLVEAIDLKKNLNL